MTTTSKKSRQPAWLTVAIREVMVKLTDKTFIIGTASTLALVAIGIVVSVLLTGRPTTIKAVVTTPQESVVVTAAGELAKSDNPDNRVEITEAANETAATKLVADGDADVYVAQKDGHWVATWKSDPKQSFNSQLTQVVQAQTISELAAATGTTAQQINEQMKVNTELLNGDSSQGMLGYFAGLGFALLFMMSSMIYGMQIATSVIEEKQSRIVEILVSVIPVRQLLAGKVVGNTAIAFAQMVLLLGTALIGLSFTNLHTWLPRFSGAIGWFLLFFLAGFLALACIWAAAGALGTRNEDLNQTSSPLMWVIMLTYVAGFAATGTVKVILSFVPIVSSVLMPVRLVEGSVSWWEPAIALVINLIFAAGMVLLGERIYRRALLRTSGRMSYRQALALKE